MSPAIEVVPEDKREEDPKINGQISTCIYRI